MEPQDVILGIDLGSTSTRAAIYVGAPLESLHFVQNVSTNQRLPFGDFTSACYPFDDGPAYVGVEPNPDRDSISMKYGFYLLAGASDDLLNQYNVMSPLLQYRNDRNFCDKIRSAIKSLLEDIWQRVQLMCHQKHWEISAISLTIPSQWTLEFEEVYRNLASEAFRFSPEKITFVTEAEALTHYICHDRPGILQPQHPDESGNSRLILLLDFGGHNMNSCILAISYANKDSPSFFLSDKPKAAAGGSEQWEYYIANTCIDLIRLVLDPGRRLAQYEKQILLDKFHSSMSSLMGAKETKPFTWMFRGLDGKDMMAHLSADIVERNFLKALKNPEALAKLQIQTISKLSEGKARVLVTGGTSRSGYFQRQIAELCRAHGLTEPEFIESWGVAYFHARIAEGAAYAVAHPLSVESFIARGAGFGLQMLQGSSNNSEALWDDAAEFLFTYGYPEKRIYRYLSGNDQLKIICNPFFNRGPSSLRYEDCYDFMYLGRPMRGYWAIEMSFYESEGQTRLQIKANRRKKRGDPGFRQINKSFPLYVHLGARTLHPGEPGQDEGDVTSQLQSRLRSARN
ncbi:hypothetical protein F4801DRAFT_597202 [Xylaria longipes]|nr:hypothetical protein F4801DRAFT_597202 [Xylaria longipes]